MDWLRACLFMVFLHLIVNSKGDNGFAVHSLPDISRLCPNVPVCEPNFTRRANFKPGAENGCCTPCYCDPECAVYGDCCFQEMDPSPIRTYQECTEPVLHQQSTVKIHHTMSYFFVNKPPASGCEILEKDRKRWNETDFLESRIAPWGSVYLVTGKHSKYIYKNYRYAQCHGEIDVIYWNAYLSCGRGDLFGTTIMECDVHLRYPGDVKDLLHEECFPQVASSCPNDTVPMFGYTIDELIAGCESGLQSPLMRMSREKNAFCFVCRQRRKPTFIRRCPDVVAQTFQRYKPFTFLLRHSLITSSSYEDFLRLRIAGTVCEKRRLHSTTNPCRPMFCPSAMLFSVKDGRCVITARMWSASAFKVILNVTVIGARRLNGNAIRLAIQTGNYRFAWSVDWRIGTLFFHRYGPGGMEEKLAFVQASEDDALANLSIPVDSFHIELFSKRGHYKPEILLKMVNDNMRTKFTVGTRGETVEFKQAFSPFEIDKAFFDNGTRYMTTIVQHNEYLRKSFFRSHQFIPVFLGSDISRQTIKITKLLFCPLVELSRYEYETFNHSIPSEKCAVYYNRTGRILFPNEYEVTLDEDYKEIFRICVNDSPFEPNLTPANSCNQEIPFYFSGPFFSVIYSFVLSVI